MPTMIHSLTGLTSFNICSNGIAFLNYSHKNDPIIYHHLPSSYLVILRLPETILCFFASVLTISANQNISSTTARISSMFLLYPQRTLLGTQKIFYYYYYFINECRIVELRVFFSRVLNTNFTQKLTANYLKSYETVAHNAWGRGVEKASIKIIIVMLKIWKDKSSFVIQRHYLHILL